MTTSAALELTVLGAGPAYSDRPGAVGACYHVAGAGTRLLLDLGQGALPGVFATGEPADLDAVLVSHLHPDHFIDLVALRHYLRWECAPARRVAVHGPRALGDRLDALHAQAGFAAASLDLHALEAGVRRVGGLEVEARRVTHTDDSWALRVAADAGPGLVYSGDCGQAMDLAPLVRPGDTLLVEVSFGAGPADPAALHLDGPAVGALAAATRPGRVLLTHLLMRRDPAAAIASVRAAWDGPVQLVGPGDVIAL